MPHLPNRVVGMLLKSEVTANIERILSKVMVAQITEWGLGPSMRGI